MNIIFRLTLVAGFAVSITGCGQGQKSSTSPAVPPAQETAQALVSESPAPLPASGSAESPGVVPQAAAPLQAAVVQPVIVKDDGRMETTLAQLTQALRKYSMEQRRVPKSFGEVIAAGYVSGMPQPPAGKQFVVDVKHVQVVLGKQ